MSSVGALGQDPCRRLEDEPVVAQASERGPRRRQVGRLIEGADPNPYEIVEV
jgi:hypothetical protein